MVNHTEEEIDREFRRLMQAGAVRPQPDFTDALMEAVAVEDPLGESAVVNAEPQPKRAFPAPFILLIFLTLALTAYYGFVHPGNTAASSDSGASGLILTAIALAIVALMGVLQTQLSSPLGGRLSGWR